MLKSFQILGYSGGMPFQGRDVSSLILSTHNYDIMIRAAFYTMKNIISM